MLIYIYEMAKKHENTRIAELENAHGIIISTKVSASTKHFVADMIVKKARKHDVPISLKSPLSDIITSAPPDAGINRDSFEAVAEILAQIFSLDIKK